MHPENPTSQSITQTVHRCFQPQVCPWDQTSWPPIRSLWDLNLEIPSVSAEHRNLHLEWTLVSLLHDAEMHDHASVSNPPDSVGKAALVLREYLGRKSHRYPPIESNERSFLVSENPAPHIHWPITPVCDFKNHFRFEPFIFLSLWPLELTANDVSSLNKSSRISLMHFCKLCLSDCLFINYYQFVIIRCTRKPKLNLER